MTDPKCANCGRLHKAVRDLAIYEWQDGPPHNCVTTVKCRACKGEWRPGFPESHDGRCPACPTAQFEELEVGLSCPFCIGSGGDVHGEPCNRCGGTGQRP